ncbi:MAG: metallophosphoesterase family protein [Anaerolineae bacterium]|nr:metallophosphoesterase family protein [Anaerolineae bacterium]
MRIALISDIHGNAIALDTVLRRIEAEEVDRIICMGDVTAVGPQPRECLDRVAALGCPLIMGNHDRWLLTGDDGLLVPKSSQDDAELFRVVKDIDSWCREQLSPGDLDFISTFQQSIEVTLSEGLSGEVLKMLVFHGSPKLDTDIILSSTPAQALDEMLGETDATLLAGGHTHVQMIRRHHAKVIINPGSVGAPFEFTPRGEIRNPWWAEYAMITVEKGHLGIDLRRLHCDQHAITQAVRQARMPHIDWWLGGRGATL